MNTNTQNTEGNAVAEAATEQRIRKEVAKTGLQVTRVYKSDWQKEGTLTAEIKQTVKTSSFYPSKSVSNDMQDTIFGTKDFGFKEQSFENEEIRVGWINVPASATIESVTEQLKGFPNAVLYKVLSNKPILTSDQKYAVAENITTIDVIGARQVVRYPDGHPEAGSLVLDPNGKIQYRQVFFKTAAIEDIDSRTSDPADFQASEEIVAELNATGQRVI